ncbi:RusA family crossover junction endodeoxyribonuclease [Weissella viridescens]|uniref:RusA family crossover junction endodeoxyribonuclease n=1 Tax=Weissella viridescens TaxID=1629 RepID=UPI003AF2AA53
MSQKIFEALIELNNDFGSGNDLQHNTKTNTVYRGTKYHAYKDELIEALDELNDKFHVQIDKGDELAVNLTFYQTNINQTTRATKDLDNMEKPTLDAMQVALGFDDSQIVKKVSQKQSNFTRALRVELWKA